VNLSGEENKHGFRSVNDVVEAFQIGKDRLSGLMLIGAVGESERDFSAMLELKRALTAQLGNDYCCCCRLSMGMSGDYELAVKMGSSVVRVGTAIFGERGE
jgi:PLP dependent protein